MNSTHPALQAATVSFGKVPKIPRKRKELAGRFASDLARSVNEETDPVERVGFAGRAIVASRKKSSAFRWQVAGPDAVGAAAALNASVYNVFRSVRHGQESLWCSQGAEADSSTNETIGRRHRRCRASADETKQKARRIGQCP